MMTLDAAVREQIEQQALSLAGASLEVKWGGARVLMIEGKMFALLSEKGVSFKVDDDDFLALSGLTGVVPVPYLARARWIQVRTLHCFSVEQLHAALARSRHLVLSRLPRRQRQPYGL